MNIAIACDHAGYQTKEQLKSLLQPQYEVKDFGCSSSDSCDYPDYAHPAARAVSEGETDRGILVCGSAVGMAIVANRYEGVRAAAVYNKELATQCRKHNNANVLCLAARQNSAEEIQTFTELWLETSFEGGRHQRRIHKIDAPNI